jgi:hypothetical protein
LNRALNLLGSDWRLLGDDTLLRRSDRPLRLLWHDRSLGLKLLGNSLAELNGLGRRRSRS